MNNKVNYITDKQEIDAHYLMSAYDFVYNLLQHKPEILKEIQSNILLDWQTGVDLRIICQRYIWH